MPATAARIGYITSGFRRVISGPNATVETKYGKLARDNDEPVETFFDETANAQAIADARLTLLSADRRLLSVTIGSTDEALALQFDQVIPVVTIIDDDRLLNRSALVSEITIDLEQGRTEMMVWG